MPKVGCLLQDVCSPNQTRLLLEYNVNAAEGRVQTGLQQ